MTAQYGVSQPICLREPTKEDLELTAELESTLKSFNYFETDEELQTRLDVLRRINHLVKKWVRDVSVAKNLPPEQVEKAGGKLFTFGSYRLGVHTRGADIDSLCIAPRHVDRSDFFSTFFQSLKEDENVTELHAVEEAFVPVIKLRYSGIELDILFARLALKEISDDKMLDDDNLLRNLDEKSIRSLNGCRVADEILKSIPNNVSFTVALRAIKLWAKNHSIYSNSLGFLGGVSWAILVARTCQLYPNAAAAVIIEKLFLVFSTWDWPHPVFLKDSDNSTRPDIQNMNDLVWDPRARTSDRYHLMPIITPAYPEQNSTFNVTKSTRTIMTNEFKDGLLTMIDIIGKKKTWKDLFQEINFFSRYRHFICLICTTQTEEDHLVFSSLVESKIRHLIGYFERNACVNLCHINPKKFKPLPGCSLAVDYENPIGTLWFVGLELNKQMRANIDLTHEIQSFSDLIMKAAVGSNSYKETMVVKPFYVRHKDLKIWIPEAEVTRGVKYQSRKSVLPGLQLGINQSDIRGEKANALAATAALSTAASISQPNSPARQENGNASASTSLMDIGEDSNSSLNLGHSVSVPNMDVSATEDKPPAAQLPIEHPMLSNPEGLMTNDTVVAKEEEKKITRKGFFSPPTSIGNQRLFTAVAEAAVANATSEMPVSTMNGGMNPPPMKKPRFNFLSSPQNGTVL